MSRDRDIFEIKTSNFVAGSLWLLSCPMKHRAKQVNKQLKHYMQQVRVYMLETAMVGVENSGDQKPK